MWRVATDVFGKIKGIVRVEIRFACHEDAGASVVAKKVHWTF